MFGTGFDPLSFIVVIVNISEKWMQLKSGKVKRWPTTTRLLALFILLYAIADISVLQVYCGNDALGIPPDHHMSALAEGRDAHNDKRCRNSDAAECQKLPDNHDYDHQHQCFYWQQVGVGFYAFDPGSIAELDKTQLPVSCENLLSNSCLSYLFRPPKTL